MRSVVSWALAAGVGACSLTEIPDLTGGSGGGAGSDAALGGTAGASGAGSGGDASVSFCQASTGATFCDELNDADFGNYDEVQWFDGTTGMGHDAEVFYSPGGSLWSRAVNPGSCAYGQVLKTLPGSFTSIRTEWQLRIDSMASEAVVGTQALGSMSDSYCLAFLSVSNTGVARVFEQTMSADGGTSTSEPHPLSATLPMNQWRKVAIEYAPAADPTQGQLTASIDGTKVLSTATELPCYLGPTKAFFTLGLYCVGSSASVHHDDVRVDTK